MTDPGFACCTPLAGASMSTEQAEQVAPLLKALADPVRLRLVSLIAHRRLLRRGHRSPS